MLKNARCLTNLVQRLKCQRHPMRHQTPPIGGKTPRQQGIQPMAKQFTKKPASRKPDRPYKDYPLFPHANGQWAKKIRGKLHYFGPWADATAANDRWLAHKDALLAGRKPREVDPNAATVRLLVNKFLTAKQAKVTEG